MSDAAIMTSPASRDLPDTVLGTADHVAVTGASSALRGLGRSRNAVLLLVDRLARRATVVLPLIIFLHGLLAVVTILVLPSAATLRSLAIWAVPFAVTATCCLWVLSRYRTGRAYGRRPLTWRRQFVAALSILGTAGATLALVVDVTDASPVAMLLVRAGPLVIGVIAALGLAAFRGAVIALIVPLTSLPLCAVLAAVDVLSDQTGWGNTAGVILLLCLLLILSGLAVWHMNRKAENAALAARPPRRGNRRTARQKAPARAYNPYAIRARATRRTASWIPVHGSDKAQEN